MKKLLLTLAAVATLGFGFGCNDLNTGMEPGTGNHGGSGTRGESASGGLSAGSEVISGSAVEGAIGEFTSQPNEVPEDDGVVEEEDQD